jgi:hypothetical protein
MKNSRIYFKGNIKKLQAIIHHYLVKACPKNKVLTNGDYEIDKGCILGWGCHPPMV